MLKDSAILAT